MRRTAAIILAASALSGALAVWLARSTQIQSPPQRSTAESLGEPHRVTIAPFREFAFEEGAWAVYFFNDLQSHHELKGALPGTCLVLTDRDQVIRGLRALEFEPPSGADVATVTSALVLTRDGKRIYETNILVSPASSGLQSQAYGWVREVPEGSLLAFLKQFQAVTRPEVLPSGPTERHDTPCVLGTP